jgi:RNA polymerase sigma-70 factor (ECF subfamily)
MRIVTNEAQNRRRSTTRYVNLLLRAANDASPPHDEQSPEANVVADDQVRSVLNALNTLPDEDRIVLSYRYLLDLSPSEIAATLDCPASTVRSRLARALQRLQDECERAEEPHHTDVAQVKEAPNA